MNIKEIKKLKVGEVLENVDLKKYTTYKAGGKATLLVSNLVDTGDLTEKDLQEILEMIKDK